MMTAPPCPQTNGTSRWNLVLGLVAVALAAGLYRNVGFYDVSILDDAFYVLGNPLSQPGLTWRQILAGLAPRPGIYWSPLTFLSFMADSWLFGFRPGGYHLVNALWHCANVALFYLLVLRLSGSRLAAFWAALLLAAHPAHVEAVAWITARKDMLSTFFGLSAIHLYIYWVRRPRAATNLALHAAAFLSLLAKPMFVTLAGLLLLLDYWPLGRLRGKGQEARILPDARLLVLCLREKTLLLAFGVFATYMTLATHYVGQLDRLDPGLGLKLANAVVSYAKYLGLLVWPVDQAIVYPFPESVPLAQVLGAGLLLLALTALCLRQARTRPYLLVGWLWFLAALLPVSMPPKVGLHVEMADRWTYVPFLGLYLALGCLGAELLGRVSRARLRLGLAAAWVLVPVAALAVVQQRQLATWATPESIAEQALRVTDKSFLIMGNYGLLLAQKGENDLAEATYLQSLAVFPEYGPTLFNLGMLRLRQHRFAEALEPLLKDMRVEEKLGNAYDAYCSVGICLISLGRGQEAQKYFVRAIQENPLRPQAYNNWATYARDVGDFELARKLYAEALTADPGFELAKNNLRKLEEMARAKP